MMFVSNLFNMSIFMGANFMMVIVSKVLQSIWNRHLGEPDAPVLWIVASVLSVMGFSLRTSFMWSDPDFHYGSPTFLLAMGWAFSSIGTTLIATVLCAVAAESIVSSTT
jgi:mannose/fructose/N-acetylgalactosamine-specific phosphotransferase system component IIC